MFLAQENVQNQQPIVIANPNITATNNEITNNVTPDSQNINNNRTNNTVYQRIQTIQLTPQKQQVCHVFYQKFNRFNKKLCYSCYEVYNYKFRH